MKTWYLLLCLFSVLANAQGVAEQIVYGGNGDDQMYDILRSGDKFYSVGYSTSSTIEVPANYGDKDFYLAVLDDDMNFLWGRNYGGPAEDWADVIIEDSFGNFVIGGRINSAGNDVSEAFGDADIWLISVDEDGDILWELTLGAQGYDRIKDLKLMPNGDLMLIGWIPFSPEVEGLENRGSADVYLARVSPEGALLWQKGFGSSDEDSGRALVALESGEFYIAAGVSAADFEVENHISATDIWVAKLSADGEILNQATFGSNKKDTPTDMILLSNGDLLLAGETFSDEGVPRYHGSGDAFLLHLSSELEEISFNAYGGSSFDSPYEIMESSSGSIVLAGLTQSINGDIGIAYPSIDGWLLEMQLGGDIEWSRAFGGSQFESLHAVTEDSQGNIVATGYTDSVDGDVIRAHGNHLCWTIKIDELLSINEYSIQTIQAFPNPASEQIKINFPESISKRNIRIVNAEGKVQTVLLQSDILNISNLASGIYFAQLTTADRVFRFSFIKE